MIDTQGIDRLIDKGIKSGNYLKGLASDLM